MLQTRQEKPISPQELFSRLLSQSYRQIQCEDESEKLKKQRLILMELISQYEISIQSKLIRINQCQSLQRLKLQKIQELERIKKQRDIVDQSVQQQFTRVQVSQGEEQEKLRLISQLQQVRCVNNKIRLKLRDLHDYILKLEYHNQELQKQKEVVQTKLVSRMRVHSQDWRNNIDLLKRKQELEENQLRAKLLEKETESLKSIRRQEHEIERRNQQRWDEFKRTAMTPTPLPTPLLTPVPNQSLVTNEIRSYVSRPLRERTFDRYRVI